MTIHASARPAPNDDAIFIVGLGSYLPGQPVANEAIAAGATDNGKPGLRPMYHADYYGAFVLDPDGINVEAVIHTVEPSEVPV